MLRTFSSMTSQSRSLSGPGGRAQKVKLHFHQLVLVRRATPNRQDPRGLPRSQHREDLSLSATFSLCSGTGSCGARGFGLFSSGSVPSALFQVFIFVHCCQ